MDGRNLIRIDDLTIEVYRIFSIQRFIELLQENKLTLLRPRIWDDPFENVLLRRPAIDGDGNLVSMHEIADKWYGLCWTYNRESDAMWRIYSPGKDGVRIKSRIGKIAEAIWEPMNNFSRLKYFIGKVQYCETSEIEDFLNSTTFWDLAFGGQNDKFAESLLVKRTEFDHEREIRVLANNADNDSRANGDTYKIDIDPNYFIEEVCLDPRLTDNEVDDYKTRIAAFGFKGYITQSALYKVSLNPIKLS